MLSKNDIQQIGQIVDQTIEKRLEPMREDVKSLKVDMTFVKKKLRGLQMKTSRIKNTLDVAIKMFDRNHVNHGKRLEKIEDHLGFVAS